MAKKKILIIIGIIVVILVAGYAVVWLITPFPIHYAAERGILLKVKGALRRGANINLRDSSGDTPLHSAIFFGKYDVVEYLLNEGADIHAKDDSGNTPLIISAKSPFCDIGITQLLLKHGARVNEQNDKEETALYWVFCFRVSYHDEADYEYELVHYLFEHGAKFVGKMDSDIMASMIFEIAIESEYFRTAKLLVENGILELFDDPSYCMSKALQAWQTWQNRSDRLAKRDISLPMTEIQRCEELIQFLYDKKVPLDGLDDEEQQLLTRIITKKNSKGL